MARYQLYTVTAEGKMKIDEQDEVPSLATIQSAVGGYIETVPYFDRHNGSRCVAFCDEEGKIKRKPINAHATAMWAAQVGQPLDDVLVGDIIIICSDEEGLAEL